LALLEIWMVALAPKPVGSTTLRRNSPLLLWPRSGKAIRSIRTAIRFKWQKPQSLRCGSLSDQTIDQITRSGFLPEGIMTEAHIQRVFGGVRKITASRLAADDRQVS
jgi:hypothetical protein